MFYPRYKSLCQNDLPAHPPKNQALLISRPYLCRSAAHKICTRHCAHAQKSQTLLISWPYLNFPTPDHIRQDPACEPCSRRAAPRRSLLVRERPGTSGNVLGAPGGKHGRFGKFKTAVFLRDGPGRWQHPGWSVSLPCRFGMVRVYQGRLSVSLPCWSVLVRRSAVPVRDGPWSTVWAPC